MKQITIECKNIIKKFGKGATEIATLRGISLTAYESELIMLMGPSGSGKTTLISIIGGILQQDSGECLILGRPINQLPEQERTVFRGKNIGFIFQNFNLIPTLNAIENAAIPLLLNGYARAQAFEIASQLLQSLGLEDQRYRIPSELSGGEQQRVAIARACINKPKIILCDEPTSFLDLERGKKTMQILQDIKAENNCTLIVVTHDPRILEFADRILEIEDGMIKESKNNPQPT
jgi:putative ABC transport system ATP-binding protein